LQDVHHHEHGKLKIQGALEEWIVLHAYQDQSE